MLYLEKSILKTHLLSSKGNISPPKAPPITTKKSPIIAGWKNDNFPRATPTLPKSFMDKTILKYKISKMCPYIFSVPSNLLLTEKHFPQKKTDLLLGLSSTVRNMFNSRLKGHQVERESINNIPLVHKFGLTTSD